ncbi:N-acetyltransferase family protein [Micromonospora sp. BQ11]|uniref:GNAT family N-acetyltransferase n=1 Tax=Micromonospora sp. BQ11 TaxID=3452212 RepID=UPI003F8BF5E5
MTVTLRPGAPGDLMAVGALHHRSRVAAYSAFLPPEVLSDPSPEAMGLWWTERWGWERDDHTLTVAERDGALAGFSYVGPDDEGDPSTGILHAIHLEPAERGRGVGRALMVDALATMRTRSWRRAALWVLRENAHARRFYERGGWTPTGVVREEWMGSRRTPQLRYARDL